MRSMASNLKARGQSVNDEILDGESDDGSGRAIGQRYVEVATGAADL
jgi:hypothetical protein